MYQATSPLENCNIFADCTIRDLGALPPTKNEIIVAQKIGLQLKFAEWTLPGSSL